MYQIDEQIGDEANHCKFFLENKEVISLSKKFYYKINKSFFQLIYISTIFVSVCTIVTR